MFDDELEAQQDEKHISNFSEEPNDQRGSKPTNENRDTWKSQQSHQPEYGFSNLISPSKHRHTHLHTQPGQVHTCTDMSLN